MERTAMSPLAHLAVELEYIRPEVRLKGCDYLDLDGQFLFQTATSGELKGWGVLIGKIGSDWRDESQWKLIPFGERIDVEQAKDKVMAEASAWSGRQ
jgi:hypothetical protein